MKTAPTINHCPSCGGKVHVLFRCAFCRDSYCVLCARYHEGAECTADAKTTA